MVQSSTDLIIKVLVDEGVECRPYEIDRRENVCTETSFSQKNVYKCVKQFIENRDQTYRPQLTIKSCVLFAGVH